LGEGREEGQQSVGGVGGGKRSSTRRDEKKAKGPTLRKAVPGSNRRSRVIKKGKKREG